MSVSLFTSKQLIQSERADLRFFSQISEEDAYARVKEARAALKKDPTDGSALGALTISQLFFSWGIRGDNTPEYAEYLGYLSGKDLYPDFKFTRFEEYIQDVLDGKAKGVYQSGSQ
jgi:hypothetical protein